MWLPALLPRVEFQHSILSLSLSHTHTHTQQCDNTDLSHFISPFPRVHLTLHQTFYAHNDIYIHLFSPFASAWLRLERAFPIMFFSWCLRGKGGVYLLGSGQEDVAHTMITLCVCCCCGLLALPLLLLFPHTHTQQQPLQYIVMPLSSSSSSSSLSSSFTLITCHTFLSCHHTTKNMI